MSTPEDRLKSFGLSTQIVHDVMTPGIIHARNRTALALGSARGTDIYQDSMEQLALRLAPSGWQLVYVGRQPRILHPDGLLSVTVASATGLSRADPQRQPRTHPKGPSTRSSLDDAPRLDMLFDTWGTMDKTILEMAELAPLWFLLHERTPRGLYLELSRPSEMNQSDVITDWSDYIQIPFLDVTGDMSVFGDDGDDDFDVPVRPR